MSTRATYRITTELTEVYFYIHCDNYPEGAAFHIKSMLEIDHKQIKCPAKRFLLGNIESAQFTENHEAHGDTEYYYNIYDNMIAAYKTGYAKPFFKDTINQFLKKYLEQNNG